MFLRRSRAMTMAMDEFLEEVLRSAEASGPNQAPQPVNLLLNRWYSDQERTVTLRRRLLHCLRLLRPEHASLVSEAQRKNLYFELQRTKNDPYLVCAILKGLAGIEDKAAVPFVLPLAEGGKSAAEFPHIKAAALECLLSLKYFE